MPETDPHNTELYQLLALSRDIHSLWHSQNAQLPAEKAVTYAERGVLEILVSEGAQPVPSIARARFVSRQHIQKLVDDLASKGLVELQPNPAHKASPLVDATIAGERAYTVAASGEAVVLNAIAPDLAHTDLSAAIDALRA
ncbi:MAG: MarR family winged helix-turn-helix transcriptional regulator, partial [Boseongicola sp.]